MMKNVSVYVTSPSNKSYSKEVEKSIKIWIDNSLDLGWKIEDLLLINNFPWKYGNFESTVVPDDNFCPFRPGSSKTLSVANLLNLDFFSREDLLWIHDPDCFQMEEITEQEIREKLGTKVAGFTDYGNKSKWSMGSYFITTEAKDIFSMIKNKIYERYARGENAEDENSLVELTEDNTRDINNQIVRLNVTYNFGTRNLPRKWKVADKPIKTLHFRPFKEGLLDIYMYGKNELGFPIMNKRLRKVFKFHRVT